MLGGRTEGRSWEKGERFVCHSVSQDKWIDECMHACMYAASSEIWDRQQRSDIGVREKWLPAAHNVNNRNLVDSSEGVGGGCGRGGGLTRGCPRLRQANTAGGPWWPAPRQRGPEGGKRTQAWSARCGVRSSILHVVLVGHGGGGGTALSPS